MRVARVERWLGTEPPMLHSRVGHNTVSRGTGERAVRKQWRQAQAAPCHEVPSLCVHDLQRCWRHIPWRKVLPRHSSDIPTVSVSNALRRK